MGAVGKSNVLLGFARHDAFVTAIFGQGKLVLVGEPGQLCGKLVFLLFRRRQENVEAFGGNFVGNSFDPPDVVDIGDDPFAVARRCNAAHERGSG